MIAILSQLTPRVEVYSIDEAFCDLTGIPAAQLESLGRQLREEVRRRTHLTVGVGIAPTKTLANYAAKTWHKTGGVMLGDFSSERVAQFGLFDDAPPRKNSDRLMQLLDTAGRRCGLPGRVFPIGPMAGR